MSYQDPAFPTTVTIEANGHEEHVDRLTVLHAGNGVVVTAPADVPATSAEPTAGALAADIAGVAPSVWRFVSGRYRSAAALWQLELRVDVDGRRPMKRFSGDYYRMTGSTVSYFGSFIVEAPTVQVTPAKVIVEGLAETTWKTSYHKLRVTIARTTPLQPPASAQAQWMTPTNQPGAAYTCTHESPYLRAIQFEQDYVVGITGETPFASYDTGELPSGGPARVLSVETAYAEAGLEMQTAGTWNPLAITGAGPDSKWSNAELHAAMQRQFSLWQDVPQWKVWLLAAELHEMGPGLLGIMFDQQGKQRQGCAIFHAGVGGITADLLRLQLYTYVHELGHCFNLFHSFHKAYMQPPLPNRPAALSWMNYPWRYPGGPNVFWSAFPFQFDDLELLHLRHAFRNHIIIGGNPFGVGAALEAPDAFADAVVDDSGLRLEVESPKPSFAFGEPVVVELKLKLTDLRGKTVHTQLHPHLGSVQLGIRKPGGQVVLYQPLMAACMAGRAVRLDANTPAIYDSVYIGFGKDGFYFDQIGTYHLRAAYYAMDGSEVMSNIVSLRVRAPRTAQDEAVADLFFGEEQGTLLYLLGSDAADLKRGNAAFEEVLVQHRQHPLAVYAQLVKGINDSREFKTLVPAKQAIEARPPRLADAKAQLDAVVDTSIQGQGVDNITLNYVMGKLAAVQHADGDTHGAQATIRRMVEHFSHKQLKPHVQRLIERMAREKPEALISEERPGGRRAEEGGPRGRRRHY